jgi:hypothetical protein
VALVGRGGPERAVHAWHGERGLQGYAEPSWYAWFSICAIAFGGRLLEFAATADEAARVATRRDLGSAASPAGSSR